MRAFARFLMRMMGVAYPRYSARDVEIDRVRAALDRHNARITAMDDEWARLRGPCCPSCMFGMQYTEACEKALRTRRWLVVLLRKRGAPADLARASALDDAWLD